MQNGPRLRCRQATSVSIGGPPGTCKLSGGGRARRLTPRAALRILPIVDGLIILDKPKGITSAKALYRVRKITRQRKSGHGGTLDPGATGVLILCLGKATKLTESIMDHPKVYRATARLDFTSESLDSDSPLEPVEVPAVPTLTQIHAAARGLEGEIMQAPPAISAVKIGGVPAYRRARQGRPIDPAPRPVRVYWLHIHGYRYPELEFEMCCGRGTYVRSLIRDWGRAVGAGGCLTSLARTRIGPFGLEEAHSFEALEASTDPLRCLVPLEAARSLLATEHVGIPPRPAPETPA